MLDILRRRSGIGRYRHRRVGGVVLVLPCLAASILACGSPVGPLPSNAVSYTPPAVYTRWWAMVEGCSGLSGALAWVSWYKVPGSAVLLNGRWVSEYWSARGNFVVIPESLADDATGVRHEMLHALIADPSHSRHPRDQFLGRCAGVVDCGKDCARDAGSWLGSPPHEIHSSRDSGVSGPKCKSAFDTSGLDI